jgi:hypothetical protein
MARPKRKTAEKPDYIGITLNKAGDNATADIYQTYERNEVPGGDTSNPGEKNSAYAKARKIARTNYWLREFLKIKFNVMNYGLWIAPASDDGQAPDPKDVEKLAKWMSKKVPLPEFKGNATDTDIGVPSGAEITNGELVRKFIKDAWREYLLLNSVIAFWRDDLLPITLRHERCRYKDVFGTETLFYQHGLGLKEIALLPKEQQDRFKSKSEIAIDWNEGEYFKVLKDELTGDGLPWPDIQAIFRTIDTMESMEMGESTYAFSGRQHFRHHLVGHPIESGPMAGKPVHFWKTERGKKIREIFENKKGFLGDYCGNFDHELKYWHEDINYFDEDKWKSPEHRLNMWGGPLAQMMIEKQTNPFLSQLLRAEGDTLRGDMATFLESAINQGFGPKPEIKVGWSNLIFNDSRVLAEYLKFGVSCGAVSQQTWREECGFNDVRERQRKEQEALAVKKDKTMFQPAYDPAHGDPNQLDAGGKPAGGSDADSKNQA